jgi:ankyrin repeat protein
MIFSEEDLPKDVPSLQELVLDLSRRLQNAQHTLEAERKASVQAQRQAEYFRNRLSESVRAFRLESARVRNSEFKTTMYIESKKYEDNKSKGNTIHEELRLLELDHNITGNKHFVPVKLQRLRTQAKQLELYQESQKHTLQQLNEQVQLQESLTTAIQQSDVQSTITLLRQGADINYVDNAGYLPLHYACVYGMYDIAELLLEWGSDYTSYLSGHAPIVLASQNGHVNIIRLLLDYGASIEEAGKSNTPPLIAALQGSHFSTVEFLLQNGALVNSVDKAENTALHLSTRLPLDSARHMIAILLDHDADPTKLNRMEQTPETMGLNEHHREAAIFLREMARRKEAEKLQRQLLQGDTDSLDNLLNNNFEQVLQPMPGIESLIPPFSTSASGFIGPNDAEIRMLGETSQSLPSVPSSVSEPSLQPQNQKQAMPQFMRKPLAPSDKQLKSRNFKSATAPTNKNALKSSKSHTSFDRNSSGGESDQLLAAMTMHNTLEQPSIASSVTYDS